MGFNSGFKGLKIEIKKSEAWVGCTHTQKKVII
jgi:hypothetical protein